MSGSHSKLLQDQLSRLPGRTVYSKPRQIVYHVVPQFNLAFPAKSVLQARAEAREYRIVRQNSIMQAELRQLAGLPASLPGPPSRLQE